MESALNTSTQSNYHSCRQSLENNPAMNDQSPTADHSELLNTTTTLVAPQTPCMLGGGGSQGDATFVYQSPAMPTMLDSTPSVAMASQQVPLAQKLTGGVSHLLEHDEEMAPLRSNQVIDNDIDVIGDKPDNDIDVIGDKPDNDNNAGDDSGAGVEPPMDEDDENAARQNRSGSFTVVRDKAIPGTPIIDDIEAVHVETLQPPATPPLQQQQLSPGLMQDSASRPLIPKAKNRRSVWTADVFSPSALSSMANNAQTDASCNNNQQLHPHSQEDLLTREEFSSHPIDPFASPLVSIQSSNVTNGVIADQTVEQPIALTNSLHHNDDHDGDAEMLLVDTAVASPAANPAASAAVSSSGVVSSLVTADDVDLSYHSAAASTGGGDTRSGSSASNRSYTIETSNSHLHRHPDAIDVDVDDSAGNNVDMTAVIDAGNVERALNTTGTVSIASSASLLNSSGSGQSTSVTAANGTNGGVDAAAIRHSPSPSPVPRADGEVDDGAVMAAMLSAAAATNLASMKPGSSATITKAKAPTQQHYQSPLVSKTQQALVPPASSSPKADRIRPSLQGNNAASTNGSSVTMSPLSSQNNKQHHQQQQQQDNKVESGESNKLLCDTPSLPVNGTVVVEGGGADRAELVARISELEVENKRLKSQFEEFRKLNSQLVSGNEMEPHFGVSAPSCDDLVEFHRFVQARLVAAEEVSDDYRGLEASFHELHRRYEKARAVIAESTVRDRQLQSDLVTMKAAAALADERVNSLMRDYDANLKHLEQANAQLNDTLRNETLKSELRIGQMEIEARNLQQQLHHKETQIADLNRLLSNAMAQTAARR